MSAGKWRVLRPWEIVQPLDEVCTIDREDRVEWLEVREGLIGIKAEEWSFPFLRRLTPVEENAEALLEALKGVVGIADRATSEFDAARDAIVKAEGGGQ